MSRPRWRRAIEIMPRNTEYLALRALELDYDGADSMPVLKRIASLNPLASAPRIQLGLAAEIHGDPDSAERWLLDAARVDRQFEPRWTLANFYLRRENPAEFWKWMRLALQVSYGDRRPAFDLCWRMSEDPREILTRAIPERHEVLAAYLAYLLEEHRLPAAAAVALKLAAAGDPKTGSCCWPPAMLLSTPMTPILRGNYGAQWVMPRRPESPAAILNPRGSGMASIGACPMFPG